MNHITLPRLLIASLCMLLAACAQDRYYQPTESTADTGSGVTVFGTIDANVTHTR